MTEFHTDLGFKQWKVCCAAGLWSFQSSHFQSFESFTQSLLWWLPACGNKCHKSQIWGDGKQIFALSYQWLCGVVPEAFLRCLGDTCALRLTLTDAISRTGSETTRFQSHHCCEGNCLGLSHKSCPPCALQAKTYIYTLTQHTYTHMHVHTKKTTLNSFITFAGTK